MKVFISLLATAVICGGGLLTYEVLSLDGRIERLEGQIASPQAPPAGEPVPASYRDDPALAQRLSDLAARIGQLELAARREAPARTGSPAAPPSEPAPAPNEGGPRRGGVADARAFFGRSDEELTPEERARRDEMRAQFQRRMEERSADRIQATIDGLDRTLQAKLSTQQRLELQQILEGERTTMASLMTAQGTLEERRAQFEAARSAVDLQVQRILSPEQYQGWLTFRAQQQGPMGGRMGPGAFGGGNRRGQGGQGGRGAGGRAGGGGG